ncbi:MAG: lipopolysaccharide biosynthesis protein [bacterium]
MRTKNSIKNITFVLIDTIAVTILSFIARKIFLNELSTYHLGLKGLFNNLLSMLSLAELGIGTAIAYNLYKPISENNVEKIKTVMDYYRRAYFKIALFIFTLGIVLSFFLEKIINEAQNGAGYLQIVFIIFLLNTCFTYIFAYKRTLIIADQKAYKLVPFTTLFKLLTIVAQCIIIITTQNFILYLIVALGTNLLENCVVNASILKRYPFLKEKPLRRMPKNERRIIGNNIKDMFFHKFGDYAINGTDNIIISMFINVSTVGLYSNYGLIIQSVQAFISKAFSSLTASFGNLIAEEGVEKRYEIFRQFNFIAFWVFGCVSVCMYNSINEFIYIWLGSEYLIDKLTVGIVLFNFYLVGLRIPVNIIKISAGVFRQDRLIPIIQAVVNLGITLLLVKAWGLKGVFAGTLVSSIAVPCWYRPIVVYKYVFKKNTAQYFTSYLLYLGVMVISVMVTTSANNTYFAQNTLAHFIYRVLFSFLITNCIIIAVFYKTKEFKGVFILLYNQLSKADKPKNRKNDIGDVNEKECNLV